MLGLLTFGVSTQQSRISFFLSQYGTTYQKQAEKSTQVLGAQTSKLQLGGRIIFALPLQLKDNAVLNKNLTVEGTSDFKGNITAPNVLYGLKAGNNITISNEKSQTPTISITGLVSSIQGQTGDITLTPGTDIAISGTTISDTSTLATVAERGTCSSCITASDVATNLIITADGTINGTAIKSGIVAPTVGGTGITEYNQGDMLYAASSNTLAALPIGAAGQFLITGISGVPQWSNVGSFAVAVVKKDNAVVSPITSVLNFSGGDFNLVEGPSQQVNFTLTPTLSSVTGVAGDFSAPGNTTLAANSGSNTTIGNATGALTINSSGLQVSAAGGVTIPANQTVTVGTIGLSNAGTTSLTSGANLVGVYPNFTNSSSNNLQHVLQDLDAAITGAGVSPFIIGNDSTLGNFIAPANTADHFVLGGSTIATSTLLFNAATADLGLGTPTAKNGTLTLFSAGAGTPASITTNSNSDVLIQNGNVGIKATPSDVDADNNPFALEVHGSIGPDQNAVYDLGSPTKQYRNLYLTGQTTSGGNITISNTSPTIDFIDTTPGDHYAIAVNNSQFSLNNVTTGDTALVVDANGDVNFAGGANSTGCTVSNATGTLTCSGNIVGTNNGTVGYLSRDNATGTVSLATPTDILSLGTTGQFTVSNTGDLNTSGNISTSGTGTITSSNGIGISSGTLTIAGFNTAGVVVNNNSGVLGTQAQLGVAQGGTGVDSSTAGNGTLLIGNGAGYTLANLTGTANQVNVTNGAGTITLSIPQDIATTSTPAFAGLSLSNANNQLAFGTGNTLTVSSNVQTAPRTATIPVLTGSDTFVFANQPQTLDNKTIGSTGLTSTGTLTFNGASPSITTGSNQDVVVSPNGTGEIVLSNTAQLGALSTTTNTATTLCRDNTTHEVVQCPANAAGVSLQLAYQSGNTINATDLYGDLGITLAAGNARQFTVTNAGNATSAFVINDTNAANHNALAIQSNGTTNLSIDENGNLSTNGTLAIQSSSNQVVLGTTNTTTINSAAPTSSVVATIPALAADDTFTFINQAQTLQNKTIGLTGLTFSGVATDITTSANNNLTIAPNGTGQIILNNATQLNNLPAAGVAGTTLCRDNTSNQITACPANALDVTLQQAYNAGNSITTNDGSNIAFTLAGGLTTPTSFTLTNAGTGNALVINDTNAATNTSLAIQSNGTTNLSINENGNLTTAGTLTSQATTNQVVLGTTNTTTINSAAPSTSRVATIPALTNNDVFVFTNEAQTLQNKTLIDNTTTFANNADNTKTFTFDGSQITTGTNRTITIPDATGTICLTTGNCAGAGGVVGGTGTQNRIVKFTTTGSNIGDSNIVDNGTDITALSGVTVGDQLGTDTLTLTQLADATSGAPTQSSNLFTLQGSYWTGATANTVGFSVQNKVAGTGPAYGLSFQNNAGTEIANLSSAGDLNLSGALTGATGIASSGTITLSGLATNGPIYTTGGVLHTESQLSPSRGGTGVDASTAGNGTLLIGNGAGYSLATLTGTANQVNVTNGAGTITLSTPQDIATTSTPAFAALNLSNATNQLVLGTTTTTTINSAAPTTSAIATIPALTSNDTFVFANQTQTLTNKTIGSSGLTSWCSYRYYNYLQQQSHHHTKWNWSNYFG